LQSFSILEFLQTVRAFLTVLDDSEVAGTLFLAFSTIVKMIVSNVFWVTAGISILLKVFRIFSTGRTFCFMFSLDEINYLGHFGSGKRVGVIVVAVAVAVG
jgi:FtsH-binding integral membrane protein